MAYTMRLPARSFPDGLKPGDEVCVDRAMVPVLSVEPAEDGWLRVEFNMDPPQPRRAPPGAPLSAGGLPVSSDSVYWVAVS
jgi:hypothetical protein